MDTGIAVSKEVEVFIELSKQKGVLKNQLVNEHDEEKLKKINYDLKLANASISRVSKQCKSLPLT